MRGLKLIVDYRIARVIVASFTDAWIETIIKGIEEALFVSHLLQMRGLKLLKMQVTGHA